MADRASSTAAASSFSGTTSHSKLPVGFFDDSLEEAKVRRLDVKQVESKQMEADWQQFQEFVAEVETNARQKEEKQAIEDEEEKKLEQMEYLDRYRQMLQATKEPRIRKRKLEELAKQNETARAVKESLERVRRQEMQHVTGVEQEDDDSESDDFDPWDWRSRGI